MHDHETRSIAAKAAAVVTYATMHNPNLQVDIQTNRDPGVNAEMLVIQIRCLGHYEDAGIRLVFDDLTTDRGRDTVRQATESLLATWNQVMDSHWAVGSVPDSMWGR